MSRGVSKGKHITNASCPPTAWAGTSVPALRAYTTAPNAGVLAQSNSGESVFTKREAKEFILKYGKKVLFPDFTNKLTWFVAGVGGTILLTPVAFSQLVYNWLVATVNLNSGVPVTLAELESSSADHWLGFGLILLALVHNIANKLIIN